MCFVVLFVVIACILLVDCVCWGVAMWGFVLFAVTFLFSLLGVWLLDLLLFATWFEYTLLVVVLDGLVSIVWTGFVHLLWIWASRIV